MPRPWISATIHAMQKTLWEKLGDTLKSQVGNVIKACSNLGKKWSLEVVSLTLMPMAGSKSSFLCDAPYSLFSILHFIHIVKSVYPCMRKEIRRGILLKIWIERGGQSGTHSWVLMQKGYYPRQSTGNWHNFLFSPPPRLAVRAPHNARCPQHFSLTLRHKILAIKILFLYRRPKYLTQKIIFQAQKRDRSDNYA